MYIFYIIQLYAYISIKYSENMRFKTIIRCQYHYKYTFICYTFYIYMYLYMVYICYTYINKSTPFEDSERFIEIFQTT